MRLRTALIGCGKVGTTHADALTALPGSELVAVCDRTTDGANAFASRYGVQAFTDVATMVREAGVQAVSVCTPHPLHAAAIEAAAANGAHVLVEKPLAATRACGSARPRDGSPRAPPERSCSCSCRREG